MENLRAIPAALMVRAQTMGVQSEIYQTDYLLDHLIRRWKGDMTKAIEGYYKQGKTSAELAKTWVDDYCKSLEFVRERNKVKEPLWSPKMILDFASGYGCVARHLKIQFPDSKIQTCDIHAEAVAFNTEVLKLESYQSSVTPEDVRLPCQDVIICLSFFSHMPKKTFSRWLKQLVSHLSPQGVLIFTAHGHVSHTCGGVQDIEVDQEGFGFKEKSEQQDLSVTDYGLTVAYPSYVLSVMGGLSDVRLARFQEGLWWRMQDAYMYAKT